MTRPGIGSVLVGASRSEQLTRNIAALDVTLSPDQSQALDTAGTPLPAFPWSAFTDNVRRSMFGGTDVSAWRP